MSSPTVHFDDSTSQVILITDLDSNASSPPNDTLEDSEVLRPKIDLEMSAKILEMAKTPIVDPESSLTLINNWGDQLSPEAVTALAQNIARSSVDKLQHAINREDRHKEFIASLRKERDDVQHRIDDALSTAETAWDRRLTEALESQEAEHRTNLEAVRAGSRATVEDLQSRLRTYEDADAVKCPEGFEENRGQVPNFPIVIDGFTMQARYVKYIDQGRVMGTAGGPNDAIFIQDLYATSRIDNDHVPEPLPAWFLNHIQANSDTYPLIIKEFIQAKDWGVHADVQRYYCCDSHLRSVEEEITTLQAQSEALRAQLRRARFRLENADVPRRFSNLQALAPTSARRGRDGNDPSPKPLRYQRTRALARGRAPV